MRSPTLPRRLRTRRTLVALAAAPLLLAAGCGGGDSEGTGNGGSGEASSGMDMGAMDEPDATPAYDVDGDVGSGRFVVLDTAPPGSDDVAGRAWLAQDDDGTTVTIELRGLPPDTEYVSHLHEQPCADDAGGEHFKLDPDGGDLPPNEVHLGFTSSAAGTGGATVTNDERVGDGAPSVVVHPADTPDNRLACADFS